MFKAVRLLLFATGLILAWLLFPRPAPVEGPACRVEVAGVGRETIPHSGDAAAGPRWRAYGKRNIAAFLLLLAATGLFAAWFLLLRPGTLGGAVSYVRVSGISMEPTLHNGDLAVVHKQRSYAEGDIVAFRVRGGVVIHRIVGRTADGFVTRGSSNEGTDPWRPTAEDIVGRLWFSVPRAGFLIGALQQPLPLAAVGGLFSTLVALSVLGPGPERRPADRRKEQ
jgi:signal peptidase I